MSHKIVEVHTWKCDIPGCKEEVTAYGDKYAEDHGWWTGELIFGHEKDICPDHVRELRKFLFDG